MKAFCIVLAAALTAPTLAPAQSKPEVAVRSVAPGKFPKPRLPALQKAVTNAVRKLPGVSVVSPNAASLKALKQLEKRRCARPTVPCAVEFGTVIGATHAVAGVIKGARSFELEVRIVDVAAGKVVASAQGALKPASLVADVDAVVAKLAIAFRPPVGSIVVASNIDGAEVRLDGRLLGRTPFAAPIIDVAVGAHEIHVVADRHAPYAGTLEVRQGAEVRIFAELSRITEPPVAPPSALAPVSAPVSAAEKSAPAISSRSGSDSVAGTNSDPAGTTSLVASKPPEPADAVEGEFAQELRAFGQERGIARAISTTSPATKAAPETSSPAAAVESSGIGLSISAGPILLVPTARVGTTEGGTLELTYFPPLFKSPSLRRMLGLSLEAGWYPLSGTSESSFSSYSFASGAAAWTTTAFVSDWRIETFPARLALIIRLSPAELARVTGLGWSLIPEVYGRAGGAAAYGRATATLSKQGAAPFATNNEAHDFAWGFYTAVGAGIGAGPGVITLEYQYSNLRLNFRFPQWNPELGDLGGNTWRLGYRLDF